MCLELEGVIFVRKTNRQRAIILEDTLEEQRVSIIGNLFVFHNDGRLAVEIAGLEASLGDIIYIENG